MLPSNKLCSTPFACSLNSLRTWEKLPLVYNSSQLCVQFTFCHCLYKCSYNRRECIYGGLPPEK
jgi:hypothetical protein